MNLFNRKKTKARGQAVLELALVLPIILSVVIGTIELGNMFLMTLRISNMSREVANVAFRDCSSLPDSAQASCLASIATRVRDEGDLLLGNFSQNGTVVASTYACEGTPVVRLAGSQSAGDGNYSTLYNTSRIDQTLAASYKRLTVGEVFYRYTPITIFGNLFNFLNEETVIYEVTIF